MDEIVRKKKEEEDARSKPKFLSKEERARLAIERRTKEVEARRNELTKPPELRNPPTESSGNGYDEVKARYMGTAPQKKKRRLNDRKFVFDWSEDADTSGNDARENVNLGFGRAHIGGYEVPGRTRAAFDRHWSEKELIEMTERDWRIFREDFNISIKGSNPYFFLM